MTKQPKPPNADPDETDAAPLLDDAGEAVPPTLVDPFVAIADPARPIEDHRLKARAVVDALPRRDVEELSRALDEATGVAESVVVTVKLSPREYRRLRAQAEASGDTEQLILRDALFEYLDRRGV